MSTEMGIFGHLTKAAGGRLKSVAESASRHGLISSFLLVHAELLANVGVVTEENWFHLLMEQNELVWWHHRLYRQSDAN